MAEAPKPAPRNPAQDEAMQREEDKRTRALEDKAYEKSKQPYVPDVLRPLMRKKTGGSVKKYVRGGVTAKYMSFTKTGKPDGMKPVTKMARGGGIEQRGKTKGRFA